MSVGNQGGFESIHIKKLSKIIRYKYFYITPKDVTTILKIFKNNF
jgi:hypothetical protein